MDYSLYLDEIFHHLRDVYKTRELNLLNRITTHYRSGKPITTLERGDYDSGYLTGMMDVISTLESTRDHWDIHGRLEPPKKSAEPIIL